MSDPRHSGDCPFTESLFLFLSRFWVITPFHPETVLRNFMRHCFGFLAWFLRNSQVPVRTGRLLRFFAVTAICVLGRGQLWLLSPIPMPFLWKIIGNYVADHDIFSWQSASTRCGAIMGTRTHFWGRLKFYHAKNIIAEKVSTDQSKCFPFYDPGSLLLFSRLKKRDTSLESCAMCAFYLSWPILLCSEDKLVLMEAVGYHCFGFYFLSDIPDRWDEIHVIAPHFPTMYPSRSPC